MADSWFQRPGVVYSLLAAQSTATKTSAEYKAALFYFANQQSANHSFPDNLCVFGYQGLQDGRAPDHWRSASAMLAPALAGLRDLRLQTIMIRVTHRYYNLPSIDHPAAAQIIHARPCSRFAFLVLPQYSMIALANAVEPLRMANILMGRPVFEWSMVSASGYSVPASNGLHLAPMQPLEQINDVDVLFVCGGVNVQEAVSPEVTAALRRVAKRTAAMGALCTGGYALAKAGLLNQYRATIHWQNLPVLREQFPDIHVTDQLFTIDRDRFTCSGGVAPLDLMLHLIRLKLGAAVSQSISEQFVVDRVRSDRDRQHIPLRAQIGLASPSLLRIAQLMESHIENPLSLAQIAAATGITLRQIQRLFRQHLRCTPKRFYLQMRLRKARELLLQTSMPISDITGACGFESPPHFTRCYRTQFGCPPSTEREILSE